MRVWKRGNVYWFELVYDGQRYQRSTKTGNRKAANTIASNFQVSLAMGDVGIVERKKAPKFEKAMADFLAWSVFEHHAHPGTSHRYQVSSAALLRFFSGTAIDTITPQDVESFKTKRAGEAVRTKTSVLNRKLRPATVNRELACLRAMFNHAIKGDLVVRNPVSRVKFLAEDNQQDRVVKYAEQRAYLAVASPTLRDVAGLILETGMRPEEVYTLRDAAVDLDAGYLQVIRGKTPAAKRRIHLTREAARILRARIDTAGPGYVFPGEKPGKPILNVNTAHTRAVRVSGVAPFRLYDLRHTWATRAAESGIDLVTLAAMMGHSRIQMVMRYAHPTQGHQATAMDKLEQHMVSAEAREKAKVIAAAERAAKSNLVVLEKLA